MRTAPVGIPIEAGSLYYIDGTDKKFISPTSTPTQKYSYASYRTGNFYSTKIFYIGDTQTGDNAQYNLTWIRVSDNLYILDRVIFNDISYDQATALVAQLNGNGVVIDGTHYRVRILSDSGASLGGIPSIDQDAYSDWGKLRKACNDDDSLMHWQGIYSLTSYPSGTYGRILRGGIYAGAHTNVTDGFSISDEFGFRPVLELIS